MIKNLNKTVELPIEGTDKTLKMNFSDKRFLSRLLKLVNKYTHFDEELAKLTKALPEGSSDLEQADYFLDELVKIEEQFKADINQCFGFSVTDVLFGEGSLPDIEDYAELFEQLTPYIVDARKVESDKIAVLQSRYGLDRVKVDTPSNIVGITPAQS